MFGYKDNREDKGIMSRIISMATFVAPVGILLNNWVREYGYATKHLFGLNIRYPTMEGVTNASKAAFKDFAKLFTVDSDLSWQEKEMLHGWTKQWQTDTRREGLIGSIQRMRERVKRLQNDYDVILDDVETLYSSTVNEITTGKYGGKVSPEFMGEGSPLVTGINSLMAGEKSCPRLACNLESIILQRAVSAGIRSSTNDSVSEATDNYINSLTTDSLEKLRTEYVKFIHKAESSLTVDPRQIRTQVSEFKSGLKQYRVKMVGNQYDNILEIISKCSDLAYELTRKLNSVAAVYATPLSATKIKPVEYIYSDRMDVKKLLNILPSIDQQHLVPKVIDKQFSEVFRGDNSFTRVIKRAGVNVGYPSNFETHVRKVKGLRMFGALGDHEIYGEIRKIIEKIDTYERSNPNKKVSLSIGFSSVQHLYSTRIPINIIVSETRANGEVIMGKPFEMAINIPWKLGYQPDSSTSTQILTARQLLNTNFTITSQCQAYSNVIEALLDGSLVGDVQPRCDAIPHKFCSGLLSEGLLKDLYQISKFPHPYQVFKQLGISEKYKIGFEDMVRFKSLQGKAYVDFEWTTIGTTKVLKSFSIIRARHEGSRGVPETKLLDMKQYKISYGGRTAEEGGVKVRIAGGKLTKYKGIRQLKAANKDITDTLRETILHDSGNTTGVVSLRKRPAATTYSKEMRNSPLLQFEKVTTEEAVNILLPLLENGVVVGKASLMQGGDRDVVRDFVKTFLPNRISSDHLFTESTWFDMQNMMMLWAEYENPELLAGGRGGTSETLTSRIGVLISEFSKNPQLSGVLQRFNQDVKNVTGVGIENLIKEPLFHNYPGYDDIMMCIYSELLRQHRWGSVKKWNTMEQMLYKKYMKAFKKFIPGDLLGSASDKARGFINLMVPTKYVPFYYYKPPASSPSYQAYNLMEIVASGGNRWWKGRKTPHLISKWTSTRAESAEEWIGLRRYVSAHTALLTPMSDDGSAIATFSMKGMAVQERGLSSYELEPTSIPGDILSIATTTHKINANTRSHIVLGKEVGGKTIDIPVKNDMELHLTIGGEGQPCLMKIVEHISVNETAKMITMNSGKYTINQTMGGPPSLYEFQFWYNIFKKDDAGSMFNVLVSDLILYAGNDDVKKKQVKDVANKILSKYEMGRFDLHAGTGELSFYENPLKSWYDPKNSNKLSSINRAFMTAFKKLKMFQRKFTELGYLSERDPRIYDGAGILTKEAENAALDTILEMGNKPGGRTFLKQWLKPILHKTGEYTTPGNPTPTDVVDLTDINSLINDIVMREKDPKSNVNVKNFMDKLFYKSDVPALLAFQVNKTDGQVICGIPSMQLLGFGSTLPFRGTDAASVKFSIWMLNSLHFRPGGQKMYSNMLNAIQEQSSRFLGRAKYQRELSRGLVPPFGVNLLDFIDKALKSDNPYLKEITENFMQGIKEPLRADSSAIALEASLYEKAGEVMDAETASRFGGDEMTGAIQQSVGNLIENRRIYSRSKIEPFLRLLADEQVLTGRQGLGFLKLPDTQFTDVGGRWGSSKYIQAYDLNFVSLSKTGKLGRGDYALVSEQTSAILNIITHMKAASTLPTAAGNSLVAHYVQKYYDSLNSYGPLKSFFHANVFGTQAQSQPSKPLLFDQHYDNFNYVVDKVAAHESIVGGRGWWGKHAGGLTKVLEEMPMQDMHYVAKYMRSYLNTIGNDEPFLGNITGRHPRYELNMDTLLEGPEGPKKVSALVSEMAIVRKKTDVRKLASYYADAFKKSILPVPGLISRAPFFQTFASVPGMVFYDPNLENHKGYSDTIVRMSALIKHIFGGDYDGDLNMITLAPKYATNLLKGELANGVYSPKSYFNSMYDMQSILLKMQTDDKVLTYNPEKRVYELQKWSTAQSYFNKKLDEKVTNIFSNKGIDPYDQLLKIQAIKQGPPEATTKIFALAETMKLAGDKWSHKEWTGFGRTVWDSVGTIGEWATKQKVGGQAYNLPELWDILGNLGDSGRLKKLADAIQTNGKLVGGEQQLEALIKNKIEIPKNLQQFIPGDLVEWKNTVIGALGALGKYGGSGVLTYGPITYRMLEGTLSKVKDLNYLAETGIKIPEMEPFYYSKPYNTPEESFFSNFKRAVTSGVDKKTGSDLHMVGKTVGALLGGYLAWTLINPNTKYLGHMPGKGGEYYDWSFTKPELDWKEIMNHPLAPQGFDENSVTLRMDDTRMDERRNYYMNHSSVFPAPSYGARMPSIHRRDIFEF